MDINLLHGWFTPTVQVLAVGLLAAGVSWRSARAVRVWLPVAAAAGAGTAGAAYGLLARLQLVPETAPAMFWWAIGLLVGALVLVLACWRTGRGWQRAAGIGAVPVVMLTLLLAANAWSGYFTTFSGAYATISGQPLPNQVDAGELAALRGSDIDHGVFVRIDAPANAGFTARAEYVYLPPAWLRADPDAAPPRLPVIVMLGAVINTTRDWVRSGDAVTTVDSYRAAHGIAPILVLADPTGSVFTDTECVNGTAGNADTHLAVELPAYVAARFGTAPLGARWAVAGWSMGGTCALTLAVRHPSVYSTFVDLGGDATVGGLSEDSGAATFFGGDRGAWAKFDPVTVMRAHGPYTGLAGWVAPGGRAPVAGGDPRSSQADDARTIMTVAREVGIGIRYDPTPAAHTWEAAAVQFRRALPWTMRRLTAGPLPPSP